MACAIRFVFRSIARRASCGSATWVRTRLRKSTSSRAAPTTVGRASKATRLLQPGTALAGSAPHTPPIYQYDHSLGVAVIGGYVYRGARIAALIGDYLYSDFASGTVWSLDYDGVNPPTNTELATAQSPTSFGEDNNGEVYVVSQGGGIFQMTESGGGGSAPTTAVANRVVHGSRRADARVRSDRIRLESAVLVGRRVETTLGRGAPQCDGDVQRDRSVDVSGWHRDRQTLRDADGRRRSEFGAAARDARADARGERVVGIHVSLE